MKQSHIFTKTRKDISKNEESKNAQILLRAGFIHKEMAGVYSYLYLGKRVLDKIQQVIREELDAIGCQEIIMTALQSKTVWEPTNRWADDVVDNWFKTNLANGTELGLAFTHEEPMTRIMREYVSSYKDLPQLTYQFQTKFRNEARAKSGIMRGREFLMKDLYSFHTDKESHLVFYNQMKDVYMKIFTRLGLGEGTFLTMSSGEPFSQYSFEFQTLSEAGEDTILYDTQHKVAVNKDDYSETIFSDFGIDMKDLNLLEGKSIEIGDIYTLGTKYSEALGLTYADANGQNIPVFMGSYGIGVSRIMGTMVEFFAQGDKMTWPEEIAPFKVHLIALNTDKSEVMKSAEQLYQDLHTTGIEVLFDDRDERPGSKFSDADLIGIPHRVIVSNRSLEHGGAEYNGTILSLDQIQKELS